VGIHSHGAADCYQGEPDLVFQGAAKRNGISQYYSYQKRSLFGTDTAA